MTNAPRYATVFATVTRRTTASDIWLNNCLRSAYVDDEGGGAIRMDVHSHFPSKIERRFPPLGGRNRIRLRQLIAHRGIAVEGILGPNSNQNQKAHKEAPPRS